MRFKIIFDKDIVSEKFTKSWFVSSEEGLATGEIIKQISNTFNISSNFHLELDNFIIPDNQIFQNIVKEDEVICAKKGELKLCKDMKNSYYNKNPKIQLKFFNTSKNGRKSIKDEQSSSDSNKAIQSYLGSSMESSESSEPKKVLKKKQKVFISESSESIDPPVKKQENVKPNHKAIIPVKSIPKRQPEPEFIPKPVYKYNIKEFAECNAEELKVNDQILYKTLEIREDCTPGISDYRLGNVVQVDSNIVIINLQRENIQQELSEINQMEVIDELLLENFQVTLDKKLLKDLRKKIN